MSPEAPIEFVNAFPILLGPFAKFPKRAISSCSSLRPFVRMVKFGSHGTDFHEIQFLSVFRNFVKKVQVSLKSDKNNVQFT
jgi:hypothetical protein